MALAQNAAAVWHGLSKTNEINGKLEMLNEGVREVEKMFSTLAHPREIGFTFHPDETDNWFHWAGGVNFRHFLKEKLLFSHSLKHADTVNL